MPGPLWHPSPNRGARRGGALPDLVVLHYTGMTSGAAALARLCDPGAEVSCHYLVHEDGAVRQLVDEEERAWHAGAGAWGAVGDVNSRSLGIEIVNRGDHPFAAHQMAALIALLGGILSRHSIPPERVIGHSDMAPGRKADPGRRFDWRGLAREGLSVWPGAGAAIEAPAQDLPALFRARARAFGYPDVADAPLLEAFRQRFRPWDHGPLCAADLSAIDDLARRFPVDRPPTRA
ncbi:N-acetylmuramoyl-L-alanine amidase [Brevirhabdus pacifica]|uniref:N-acetylmuramoyl-L-alanine amidase n=2 Tax=Brevirhabdus pacifica TaxID=1267768 RepID=A0A1U7DLV1_9RHOB|nr:N-acetylmuramoyl-L-alanine amidase [Brevirhabdus pacifica]APX90951.1 N-acetylmuramoyl-L-alanine amidase [Brevirhabdus pacifica]PJJ86454.1 N-acetylmuramoyl-L-alanine amidase [Brevirhabdus pacifica]